MFYVIDALLYVQQQWLHKCATGIRLGRSEIDA